MAPFEHHRRNEALWQTLHEFWVTDDMFGGESTPNKHGIRPRKTRQDNVSSFWAVAAQHQSSTGQMRYHQCVESVLTCEFMTSI